MADTTEEGLGHQAVAEESGPLLVGEVGGDDGGLAPVGIFAQRGRIQRHLSALGDHYFNPVASRQASALGISIHRLPLTLRPVGRRNESRRDIVADD